jgi:hypothetical protein
LTPAIGPNAASSSSSRSASRKSSTSSDGAVSGENTRDTDAEARTCDTRSAESAPLRRARANVGWNITAAPAAVGFSLPESTAAMRVAVSPGMPASPCTSTPSPAATARSTIASASSAGALTTTESQACFSSQRSSVESEGAPKPTPRANRRRSPRGSTNPTTSANGCMANAQA